MKLMGIYQSNEIDEYLPKQCRLNQANLGLGVYKFREKKLSDYRTREIGFSNNMVLDIKYRCCVFNKVS